VNRSQRSVKQGTRRINDTVHRYNIQQAVVVGGQVMCAERIYYLVLRCLHNTDNDNDHDDCDRNANDHAHLMNGSVWRVVSSG
jgi:hypothetical protein